MAGQHALLSASSAHRWLHCTPCARLEEQFPETDTPYTREGTLAHAIAELKVRKRFVEPMAARTFTIRMNKLKQDELYQEEMQGFTDVYIDYLNECAMEYDSRPLVLAEARVDYSDYAPEGFGTADCLMVGGDTLHVIDFKYGKGHLVEARGNPQLRLYALGALGLIGAVYDVKRVRMSIVQPRLNSITSDEIEAAALRQWADREVRPAAKLAFAGEGEYMPGDWCGFCKARRQCRARATAQISAAEDFGTPPKASALLTNDEVAAALSRAEPFLKWFSDLQKHALDAVLRGEKIPGWKAVEGRSNRTFSDQDAAFAALQENGVAEALLYERKPLTLAQVEKVVGRTDLQAFAGDYIVKPLGKPTLVPESDKRPPYNSAAEDFKNL